MKIYTIVPKLLYQSAKTENMNSQEKIAQVKQLGIHLVVNLWHTPDREMAGLSQAYIHKHFPDGKTPVYEEMASLADWIFNEHISKGHATLVHCWGGKNRSGLLNAMLVMRLWEFSGEQAYDYIRQRRKGSLFNMHFATWLLAQPQYKRKKKK